jgi:hypothetical protein
MTVATRAAKRVEWIAQCLPLVWFVLLVLVQHS